MKTSPRWYTLTRKQVVRFNPQNDKLVLLNPPYPILVIPIRIIIDNVVVFGILPVCEDILEQMRIVAG